MEDARLKPLLDALEALSASHPGKLVIRAQPDHIELIKTHPEPDDHTLSYKWEVQPNCRPATPDDPHPNGQHPVEGYMLVEYRDPKGYVAVGDDTNKQLDTIDDVLAHIARRLGSH
jgi:hypothetical protein